MAEPLTIDREAVAELCRRYGVARLSLFGSALTAEFDPATSDVDFLVEFADDSEGLSTPTSGSRRSSSASSAARSTL